MEDFDFGFDFSGISIEYLKQLRIIGFDEIRSTFNEDSKTYEMEDDVYHLIGMSNQSKFLNISFVFTREELKFNIKIYDVQLSNSGHVKDYWCKRN